MTEFTTPYGPHGPESGQPAHDYESDERLAERASWRRELYRIIFEHDSPIGKFFDVALIILIVASVIVVMLESVEPIAERYGTLLRVTEWIFTVLFTLEYTIRLLAARRWSRYARSFFGVIDLLAILPTYLSLIVPGGQALAVVRILRVLRVFRVLKLAQFIGSEQVIIRALRQSSYKIAVFLFAVVTVVVVVGALMYFVEGPPNGFTSIPLSMYWAIVTLTTVGFGDITPTTTLGQFIAALLMIIGYGIIAVPTGIVTAEMVAGRRPSPPPRSLLSSAQRERARSCPECGTVRVTVDAVFCRRCGTSLPDD